MRQIEISRSSPYCYTIPNTRKSFQSWLDGLTTMIRDLLFEIIGFPHICNHKILLILFTNYCEQTQNNISSLHTSNIIIFFFTPSKMYFWGLQFMISKSNKLYKNWNIILIYLKSEKKYSNFVQPM